MKGVRWDYSFLRQIFLNAYKAAGIVLNVTLAKQMSIQNGHWPQYE